MPTRRDESPTRQQDRASERGRKAPDEPRNSERAAPAGRGVPDNDAEAEWTDDPEINTHGSER